MLFKEGEGGGPHWRCISHHAGAKVQRYSERDKRTKEKRWESNTANNLVPYTYMSSSRKCI